MPYDRIGKSIEMERAGQGPYVPAVVTSYTIPSTAHPPGDSVGLNQITVPLWRNKLTIAAVAIVGLLIGVAVTLLTTPTYRARTSLQLEGFNNDEFLREVTPIGALPNSTPENYLQNQVKLLESDTLAKRVADELGPASESQPQRASNALVAQVKHYIGLLRPPLTPDEKRIKDVQKALSVRTSLQSQVIELFYEAHDPVRAARGANTVASEFVSLNREARWQLAQDTTEWLSKQAADLKNTLEASNQQLENFARSSGLVFAGKQDTLAEDRMRQVQDALSKAAADRAAKQARYEAALANPGSLMSDAAASGPLRQYETDLQNLRREWPSCKLSTLRPTTRWKR